MATQVESPALPQNLPGGADNNGQKAEDEEEEAEPPLSSHPMCDSMILHRKLAVEAPNSNHVDVEPEPCPPEQLTGKRRVTFPYDLVSSYLDPPNPWSGGKHFINFFLQNVS